MFQLSGFYCTSRVVYLPQEALSDDSEIVQAPNDPSPHFAHDACVIFIYTHILMFFSGLGFRGSAGPLGVEGFVLRAISIPVL